MQWYQIVEETGGDNNAGPKATADIAAIAASLGFRRIPVRMNTFAESYLGKLQRQIGYYRDWRNAFEAIPANAGILLQHPFHHKQLTRESVLDRLKAEKRVKYIAVVHDVEAIREIRFDDYYAREFAGMLGRADVLIVHNPVMRKWFEEQGVPGEKLVSLEIFDYLYGGGAKRLPDREQSITIAGNLDARKSPYIAMLGDVRGVKIHLYGSNYDATRNAGANIEYHGSLPPDALPGRLTAGFGLVWDGESLDGCQGPTGLYLKYNNPHKLSLYLASGLPVIIWKRAAEADFVRKKGVGLCVDGLRELGDALGCVTEEDYWRMAENADRIGARLRTGYYGGRAIERAMRLLEGGAE